MTGQLGAALARIWTLNEKENVLELQASAGLQYLSSTAIRPRIRVGTHLTRPAVRGAMQTALDQSA